MREGGAVSACERLSVGRRRRRRRGREGRRCRKRGATLPSVSSVRIARLFGARRSFISRTLVRTGTVTTPPPSPIPPGPLTEPLPPTHTHRRSRFPAGFTADTVSLPSPRAVTPAAPPPTTPTQVYRAVRVSRRRRDFCHPQTSQDPRRKVCKTKN